MSPRPRRPARPRTLLRDQGDRPRSHHGKDQELKDADGVIGARQPSPRTQHENQHRGLDQPGAGGEELAAYGPWHPTPAPRPATPRRPRTQEGWSREKTANHRAASSADRAAKLGKSTPSASQHPKCTHPEPRLSARWDQRRFNAGERKTWSRLAKNGEDGALLRKTRQNPLDALIRDMLATIRRIRYIRSIGVSKKRRRARFAPCA